MSYAVSATLQDVEFAWLNGTMRVSLSLEGRDTAEFSVHATESTPQVGQKIGVFDQGERIFGGLVQTVRLRPEIRRPGATPIYDVVCAGWQLRLERHKIPAIALSDMSAGQMVDALLFDCFSQYQEEIHVAEIGGGAEAADLGTLIFRGMSYWDAIQELAKRSNYIAFITPDQFFYFVPREHALSPVVIDAATKNYRNPETAYDRNDYYNAASIAISLEAFEPYALSVAGDASHPSFDVYDPDDPEKKPLPIEAIRAIKLNGVDQEFGILGTDQSKALYYNTGRSLITWDGTQPTPTTEDTITVEFWAVGQNVITVGDAVEIAAVRTIEGDGSGRYHAYFEDLEELDIYAATQKLNAFLTDHAPGRRPGGTPGQTSAVYSWTMFSTELRDPESLANRQQDFRPGMKVSYHPSTPVDEQKDLLIQSVEISHEGDVTQYRYDITAVEHAPVADDLEFYKALAEIPVAKPKIDLYDPAKQPPPSIVFDLNGAVGTGIVTSGGQPKLIEIAPGIGRVFRCRMGFVHAGQAPAGADIKVHLEFAEYTEDENGDPLPYASLTWNSMFLSTDGDLVLPDGQIQMTTPLGKFYGFPEALDLSDRCLVRCNIIQVGSTTAGTNLHVQIIGEIRDAEPAVINEEDQQAA